jgi:uncharacterized protein YbjT (DUF2867 family)
MKIAIIGATGYVGHNLINELLSKTDAIVVAFAPNITKLKLEHERLSKIDGDVFDTAYLKESLHGCSVVYYLIHMMAQKKLDFAVAETKAAQSFIDAASDAGVDRVIYVGGLGNDADKLSKHLASRHKTGEILRSGTVRYVIEFRASMIIGQGSISYDIIANLVHKLPVLTLPAWSKTLTQPIALQDALAYLVAAIDVHLTQHEIIEIGGPEALSYKKLMQRYAVWKGTKALFIDMPIIPVGIAAWWLNLFTPGKHAKVGRAMVESLGNPMVVTNNRAKELFPDIQTRDIEEAFV